MVASINYALFDVLAYDGHLISINTIFYVTRQFQLFQLNQIRSDSELFTVLSKVMKRKINNFHLFYILFYTLF